MKVAGSDHFRPDYPRTYRMSAAFRRFAYGLAIFLLGLFAVTTPLHLTGFMEHPMSHQQLLWTDSFVLIFAVWVCERATRRVILSEDAIEVAGWLSKRTIKIREIRGRRMGKLPARAFGGSYYIIVPLNQRDMKLPPLLEMDKYFFKWMKGIPKLEL